MVHTFSITKRKDRHALHIFRVDEVAGEAFVYVLVELDGGGITRNYRPTHKTGRCLLAGPLLRSFMGGGVGCRLLLLLGVRGWPMELRYRFSWRESLL